MSIEPQTAQVGPPADFPFSVNHYCPQISIGGEHLESERHTKWEPLSLVPLEAAYTVPASEAADTIPASQSSSSVTLKDIGYEFMWAAGESEILGFSHSKAYHARFISISSHLPSLLDNVASTTEPAWCPLFVETAEELELRAELKYPKWKSLIRTGCEHGDAFFLIVANQAWAPKQDRTAVYDYLALSIWNISVIHGDANISRTHRSKRIISMGIEERVNTIGPRIDNRKQILFSHIVGVVGSDYDDVVWIVGIPDLMFDSQRKSLLVCSAQSLTSVAPFWKNDNKSLDRMTRPCVRTDSSLCFSKGRLFLYGGETTIGKTNVLLNDLWMYSCRDETWTLLLNIYDRISPPRLKAPQSIAAGNQIFLWQRPSTLDPRKLCFCLDLDRLSWRDLTDTTFSETIFYGQYFIPGRANSSRQIPLYVISIEKTTGIRIFRGHQWTVSLYYSIWCDESLAHLESFFSSSMRALSIFSDQMTSFANSPHLQYPLVSSVSQFCDQVCSGLLSDCSQFTASKISDAAALLHQKRMYTCDVSESHLFPWICVSACHIRLMDEGFVIQIFGKPDKSSEPFPASVVGLFHCSSLLGWTFGVDGPCPKAPNLDKKYPQQRFHSIVALDPTAEAPHTRVCVYDAEKQPWILHLRGSKASALSQNACLALIMTEARWEKLPLINPQPIVSCLRLDQINGRYLLFSGSVRRFLLIELENASTETGLRSVELQSPPWTQNPANSFVMSCLSNNRLNDDRVLIVVVSRGTNAIFRNDQNLRIWQMKVDCASKFLNPPSQGEDISEIMIVDNTQQQTTSSSSILNIVNPQLESVDASEWQFSLLEFVGEPRMLQIRNFSFSRNQDNSVEMISTGVVEISQLRAKQYCENISLTRADATKQSLIFIFGRTDDGPNTTRIAFCSDPGRACSFGVTLVELFWITAGIILWKHQDEQPGELIEMQIDCPFRFFYLLCKFGVRTVLDSHPQPYARALYASKALLTILAGCRTTQHPEIYQNSLAMLSSHAKLLIATICGEHLYHLMDQCLPSPPLSTSPAEPSSSSTRPAEPSSSSTRPAEPSSSSTSPYEPSSSVPPERRFLRNSLENAGPIIELNSFNSLVDVCVNWDPVRWGDSCAPERRAFSRCCSFLTRWFPVIPDPRRFWDIYGHDSEVLGLMVEKIQLLSDRISVLLSGQIDVFDPENVTQPMVEVLNTAVEWCKNQESFFQEIDTNRILNSYDMNIPHSKSSPPSQSPLNPLKDEVKANIPQHSTLRLVALFNDLNVSSSPDSQLPLPASSPHLTTLLIPLENLVIEPAPFASGADGEIYAAEYLGITVAVKKLTTPDASFRKELEQWCHFRHPNILQLLGFSQLSNSLPLIVMELMDQSLYQLLNNHQINLPWESRLKMAHGIAAGLVYLHVNRRIIHRDIKSLNILVKHLGNEVKIADFGASRANSSLTSKIAGTPRWLAPELYDNQPPTFAVDIYAFGITMNELLTRRPPFLELGNNEAAITKAVISNQRPKMDPFPSSLSTPSCYPLFVRLIQRCWDQDPLQRLSATMVLHALTQMLKHPMTASSSSPSSSSPTSSSAVQPHPPIDYNEYVSNAFTFDVPISSSQVGATSPASSP